MKFTVENKIFLDGIKTVQRVSFGNVGITALDGILIRAYKKEIILIGGDKNLCIETRIKADVREEGSIVVDSKIFGDIIRKLPNALVEINKIDDKYIQILCEKDVANLVYKSEEVFPEIPSIKENIMISLPQKIMKNMIKGTIFASSQDGIKPIFSGVLFDFKDNKLNMVALDGYRAALLHHFIENDAVISAIIPAKTLNEIEKILEWEQGEIEITFTTNHILFTLGKTKIISRLLEGDFGRYESYIPEEYKLKIIVKRKDFINSLERASIISREGNKSLVVLDVHEDNMTITANSQLGTSRSELNIVSNHIPMTIKFNSRYLIDAINTLEEDEIVIEFTNKYSVCVIKNKSSDNYIHIISPVRM
ncbi:DNA polymerase III subunit beta [Clostridium sp. UBA6640]|uniref:DNA polymerase III subunit beta n=1 Tax=Clostridium sp. UBA6640 TaxID=1946370 RepID=UPI0025BD6A7E|nr:DNA polymerase III subunit beta [Clostridium sp. UBA6640]